MNEHKQKTIKVGTVQLYSEPGQLVSNLAKAEQFVRQAAGKGAQLILLPELFNTGYQYDESNYSLAEPRGGRSWRWMVDLAAELGVHLAGTLLLRKDGDIYNTLLLIAPDGRSWEYNKQRPFFWERAYFRPGHGPLIAETELGRIGLLICWDVAHPELFASYAGKVDLMLIPVCAANFQESQFRFVDGERIDISKTIPFGAVMKKQGAEVFKRHLQDYVAHLNVPAIVSGGAPNGRLQTKLPRAKISYLFSTFKRPTLWRRLGEVADGVLENRFLSSAALINRLGVEIGQPKGMDDELVMGEIELLAQRPTVEYAYPLQAQLIPEIYQIDRFFNRLLQATYEKALRQKQGEKTAVSWLLGAASLLFLFYKRSKRKGEREDIE